MNVTYYLPAHTSYFPEAEYTPEQVDKAISLFKFIRKPNKLGEIPEAFVFLTEPGKVVGPVFDSKGMNSPDERTEERWIKNTMRLAWSAYEGHLEEIMFFLEGRRRKKSSPEL